MTQPNQSNFSWEDFHAKISQSQEEERDLQEKNQAYFLSLPGFQENLDQNGFSLKMLQDCSHLPMGEISQSYSQKWPRWGMAFHGGFWMLDSSEQPSEGVEYSLSDILEKTAVNKRYALSARAAKGMLKRAEARGKTIKPDLKKALNLLAASHQATKDLQ